MWSEVMENYAARQAAATASADLKSVAASNEAYREEMRKLREFAELNWVSPVLPPATVPTLDMFAEIVQSHKAQKKRLLDKAREIWQIEPGTDIIDFVFRQLQHLNGEMAVETEQRRQQVIENRANAHRGGRAQEPPAFPGDPMNSMLQDELNKMQRRSAGQRVEGGYIARAEDLG
jgi:hypothetical protein